jgi:hypothetical protein
MFGWGLDTLTIREAVINKVLLVVIGFVLTLALRLLYRNARTHRMPPLASAVLVIAVSFAGAAVWRELHSILLQLYYHFTQREFLTFQFRSIPLGTLLYDGFVLLAWSLLYYGINDWFELESQRLRIARAESSAHSARLRALQSQLEPHFLFNTLNAISTLVAEGNNPDANRMIARLSDFLRLSLETADTPEISVAEELEFVRRYLEIEQIRFADRLQVKIDAQPEAMSALVPALVLQPLVENAVKHGVLPREQGGSIAVAIHASEGRLHLTVIDDGAGFASSEQLVMGIGLSNTKTRLAELYGEDARFTLSTPPGGGVSALIDLPFRVPPNSHGAAL